MSDNCISCPRAIYWKENEGWCHVGQKRGAIWRCHQCGFQGDLPDDMYGPWAIKSRCPNCNSFEIHIDHYARHPVFHDSRPK